MSDQEDTGPTPDLSDDDDCEEGACGGNPPAPTMLYNQPSDAMPDDTSDTLSMEVQFGEGSSRHASEISSLSYQNLLDDADGSDLVRNESDESGDSLIPDDPDLDCPTDDMENYYSSNLPLPEKYQISREKDTKESISGDKAVDDASGPGSSLSKDLRYTDTDRLSDRGSVKTESSESSYVSGNHLSVSNQRTSSEGDTTPSDSTSSQSSVIVKEQVKKRNSLEVRNNIPTVGEAKSFQLDTDSGASYGAKGAKPKIRKQSPGLARRVHESPSASGSDREGSSSEREVVVDRMASSKETIEKIKKELSALQEKGIVVEGQEPIQNGCHNENKDSVDVVNEYDYVKYARVQQGNSYVGMRLACSTSDDPDENKRNSMGMNNVDSDSLDRSREVSPEKVILQRLVPDNRNRLEKQNVNEDSLVDIPLNCPEGILDEEKHFTLSPENTECDSVEVESVLSDGGKSSGGMPNVEDGLSSSQTSDAEDSYRHDSPTPSDTLRRKLKAEVEREISPSRKNPSCKPKEMDAQAIMEDLKCKREALDLAISDIKCAIHKSKSISLSSPYEEKSSSNDPIWVLRDNYAQKLKRKEEMRQVREEIERQQEEDYSNKQEDAVYEMEGEKDKLLENQITRNGTKAYQPGRGYDSDEEYDDPERSHYTRRNKGKKYSSVQNNDDTSSLSNTQNLASDRANSYPPSFQSRRNPFNSEQPQDIEYDVQKTSNYSDSDSDPGVRLYIKPEGEFDTDEETDKLLQKQYKLDQHVDIPELSEPLQEKRRSKAKEARRDPLAIPSVTVRDPDDSSVLIEGVLFRARYLGSTQLISEGQPSKPMRMMQAQEAVGRIKALGTLHFGQQYQAPEGENQPSTEVDLFVSTDKIMVLNTDLQEIMMDHTLRTISYIADIGDILVIMARRRLITSPGDSSLRRKKQAKILCHVFESDEAQLIAQSIGQAFQVAYMEFLKANGIEDPGLMREMDYQDVLNQQEIYGEELNLFANKEAHKEVIVPKLKSEPLGVVIVESGWGSMVPTVVLANMAPTGAAARCGQLNIGDQIISINGVSLVGLPLSSCQTYIKTARNQTVVKLTVVPCPPVVEVLIKRPDVKYQLGFSVQNGVICSLLRGGIAERGGVRVGHRIIEINNQSVVAVPHEKIVALLANSVGEIHMKTMPTSIFRLLTGQETPHYL